MNADAPAISSPHIVEMLEAICADIGMRYKQMVSRAYHDSLFMARHRAHRDDLYSLPRGVSHRPDEYAAPTDIVAGTRVLAAALGKLASE